MKKENVLVVALIAIALGGIYVYRTLNPDMPGNGPHSAPAGSGTVALSSGAGTAAAATASNRTGSGIAWKDYTPGMAQARNTARPVFLYFHAPWCTYCTKLKQTTFKDSRVMDYLNGHFVSIQVNTDVQKDLAKKWRVKGLPTMWFLEADGKKINSLPGYVEAGQFIQVLKYISTQSYRTMAFQEFINQS